MPVGAVGSRQASQSAPAATSGDERVQSVPIVRRLEMAAPSPTGRATHERFDVSSTQPPSPSTRRKDDQ